jgi:DNA integrity scanning protein DisA with diadenylate cyclase activity
LNAFPRELAKSVVDRWDKLVAGDYVAPPRPPEKLFRRLLEITYLASAIPEEGRFPKFNIVAIPEPDRQERHLGQVWKFNEARNLSVDEIRRLAPAVDYKKSAILVHWKDDKWEISGLVDLGTSWNRARIGLQYHYRFPECLFIQVDRPGRMKVYQGGYLVASLAEGEIKGSGIEFSLVLHRTAHNGLNKIWNEISYPKIEEPREYENFQFIAFWNTFAALANCVKEEGHGGAIIVVPAIRPAMEKETRIKYQQNSSVLRKAFIEFMNARHKIADVIVRIEKGESSLDGVYAIAELALMRSHEQLVEVIRFIAKLSGCDGAIIVTEDLRLLGFGAEIRSELKRGVEAIEVLDDMRKVHRKLDVESFGLRHRSAIKLVSRKPGCCVLVISQDGAISFVWSDKPNVVSVKRGISLINMNMPWS